MLFKQQTMPPSLVKEGGCSIKLSTEKNGDE